MNLCLLSLLSFIAFILASAAGWGSQQAQMSLANPGFEEDAANVGNPDGWSVHKDAKVRVISGNASQGNRALQVEDGYVVVFQELQIPQLASRQLAFSIDAKTLSPGAKLGVRIGYNSEDGKWNDSALLWDKVLTSQYQTYTATRRLPANAKGGRLYIGIYRSAKEGSFLLDNVQLQIGDGLTKEEMRRAVALARDGGYFLNRLAAAKEVPTERKAEWEAQVKAIIQQVEKAELPLAGKFEEHEQKIRSLNAALFGALAGNRGLMVGWAHAFERLLPDALPPDGNLTASEAVALRGERHAFGLDVASPSSEPQKLVLQVQGLPAQCRLTWRRQVFTETWYTKGKTLLADPLTQLPQENGSTVLQLSPGELVRLHADIEVPENVPAGSYAVQVKVASAVGGGTGALETGTLNLRILPHGAPPRRMAHYQFLYPTLPIVGNHTADAVRDLESHGVTDIEWPFMPPAVFDEKGNLISIDFENYDRLLQDFGPSQIRLNVFWESSYPKFTTQNGEFLKVMSPAWQNAFVQIFRRWLEHAALKGVSADRITILVADEIHSKSLESAPDEKIRQYAEIAGLFKKHFPQIKNYLTLSYYAFPADVETARPFVDVMMPHLPLPDKLSRNAPPTYNPRRAFENEIYPALRGQRGMQLWSYHVASGRSDDVAAGGPWNRAYPLIAAATGHTGIAYWAYNVSNGSTWDDTDGSLLDYNFVYDGAENNPLAKRWNVTGEKVVPSLRWEAVWAGLQDAEILLALQAALDAGKLNAKQREEVQQLLTQARGMSGDGGALAPNLTIADIAKLSARLREVYGEFSLNGAAGMK